MSSIKCTYEYAKKTMDAMIEKAQTANSIAERIIGDPYCRGDFVKFTNEGAKFAYEYNSACHCHPEYHTVDYLIPAEWINAIETKYIIPPERNIGEWALSEYENESEDTTLLTAIIKEHKAKLEADKIELERIKQEQKKAYDERTKILQEQREREEFEMLSKKFAQK